MVNISNLPLSWKLESSSRLFYTFNKMAVNAACYFLVEEVMFTIFDQSVHTFKRVKHHKLIIFAF